MKELDGKVAIVTGGSGGLGRGMVERFLEEGARVVVADLEDGDFGTDAAFARTDVADADQVQAAVDLAASQFGRLDVMVNNAGIGGSFARFLDDDFADFDRVIAVNIFGVMVGTQRAARYMSAHGGGAIVNITSIGGINAGPGVMAYRATKAAVIHFTQSVAIELADDNIRVNCIAPAHIPTAINAAMDQRVIVKAMQPLQRVGTPRDVAEAALFLASDRAAQITGIVLPVDGGTTAGLRPRPMRDLMKGASDER